MSYFDFPTWANAALGGGQPSKCLITLDMVQKEWYRRGSDPGLAKSIFDNATPQDLELSMDAFYAKFTALPTLDESESMQNAIKSMPNFSHEQEKAAPPTPSVKTKGDWVSDEQLQEHRKRGRPAKVKA